MRSKPPFRLVAWIVVTVLALLVLAFVRWGGVTGAARVEPARASSNAPIDDADLVTPEESPQREAAAEAEAATRGIRHAEDGLIAALERIGRLSMGKEEGDVSTELVPVVAGVSLEDWKRNLERGSPDGLHTDNSWRTVKLLEAGRLFERRFAPGGADPWEAEPSMAEIGGYQVIAFSLLNYNNPESPGINHLGPIVNGREYTLAVLRALPSVQRSGPFRIRGTAGASDTPDFRPWFYRALGGARYPNGAYLLDGYYAEILALEGGG